MARTIDLTGQKFGKLTVLERLDTKRYGKSLWHCQCECGGFKDSTSSSLKCGDVKSCGCLQKEAWKQNALNLDKSRKKHGMSDSRLYRIYHNMVSRCYRKSINGYENYGGRGIRVCDEWLGKNGFINFMNWSIENGYSDELTIDRLDSNGNYEPMNCKWATRKEQANNTRATIFLEYDGEKHSLTEWSEIKGLSKSLIYKRLKQGLSIEKVLGYA